MDHSLHLKPFQLDYSPYPYNDTVIITSNMVSFPLHPDKKFRELINTLPQERKFLRFLKLGVTAAANTQLWKLLLMGVGSGLSHGTMNIIYRIGIDEKASRVLDCLAIANGSLQRRYIIVDQLRRIIDEFDISNIVSIAGGSGVIPIESIFQSGLGNFELINIDESTKALEKNDLLLSQALKYNQHKVVTLRKYNRDINKGRFLDGIEVNNLTGVVIECTGLWEYLNEDQRFSLLKDIYDFLNNPTDRIILTALVNNPDDDFFKSIGFKRISPQAIDAFIHIVNIFFRIEQKIITPNGTYLTIIASKYK